MIVIDASNSPLTNLYSFLRMKVTPAFKRSHACNLRKPVLCIITLVIFIPLYSFRNENYTRQFGQQLAYAAISLTRNKVVYDPTYFVIPYPNGDVPSNKGVCSDVVIRAYRKLNIDLQELVHQDMKANFKSYPKIWGLTKPDPNIDHRRVPNLMAFFTRKGDVLPITTDAKDYLPGDIVCWNLSGKITHIGIVVTESTVAEKGPGIVHNIGQGQVIEDMLFNYTIIGHFRYNPFGIYMKID